MLAKHVKDTHKEEKSNSNESEKSSTNDRNKRVKANQRSNIKTPNSQRVNRKLKYSESNKLNKKEEIPKNVEKNDILSPSPMSVPSVSIHKKKGTASTTEQTVSSEDLGDYNISKYNKYRDETTPEVSTGSSRNNTAGTYSDSTDSSEITTEPSSSESSNSTYSSTTGSSATNRTEDSNKEKEGRNSEKMETIQENEEQDLSSQKEQKSTKEVVYIKEKAETPVKRFFNNSPVANCDVASQMEEEDDMNTIGSNETSHYKNKDTRQIPPPFIRYQFGISLKQVKKDKNQDKSDDESSEGSSDESEEENDTNESPANKTIRVVKAMLEYLYRFDPEALLVSWKNETEFSVMSIDPKKFPSDNVDIANFIDGFRINIRPSFRNYFRICIHSNKWQHKWIENKLAEWATVQGHNFYRCIIQAASATNIGWLAYSNSYTDTVILKTKLMAISDFEWGFKYQSITQTDSKKPWKHRLKAMTIIVPTLEAEIATNIISEMFYQRSTKIGKRLLSDCYLFVPPEHQMSDPDDAAIFTGILDRHENHAETSHAHIITSITCNINRYITTKHNGEKTLFQMITNIPIPEDDVDYLPLFRSIDYVADTSKIWLKGVRGPGGSGYVLTFYDWTKKKAVPMINGLGMYLSSIYGKTNLHRCFSTKHWYTTKLWKWIPEHNMFDTPGKRHLVANILNDPMIDMMKERNNIMQEGDNKKENVEDIEKLDIEQLEDDSSGSKDETTEARAQKAVEAANKLKYIRLNPKETKNSNKSVESTFTELNKKRNIENWKKDNDPDEDSAKREGAPAKQIMSVQVPQQEEHSAASSLTFNTNDTDEYQSLDEQSMNKENSIQSSSTVSKKSKQSLHSMKETDLLNNIKDGMTEEEIEQTVQQTYLHYQRSALMKRNKILAMAKQKFKNNQEENETHKTNKNPNNQEEINNNKSPTNDVTTPQGTAETPGIKNKNKEKDGQTTAIQKHQNIIPPSTDKHEETKNLERKIEKQHNPKPGESDQVVITQSPTNSENVGRKK